MLPENVNGNNLGERHKNFNELVQKTTSWEPSYDIVNTTGEESDIRALLKVDVASKFKKIEVLIKVLKCGDSLLITRALTCLWIYDQEHSNIISPNNLHNEIFPFMSEKMKRTTLKAISANIKDEARIQDFCMYCVNNKRDEMAWKFLIHASDDFKLTFIKMYSIPSNITPQYLQQFVGSSFKLVHALKEKIHYLKLASQLSYLYNVSENEYLNFLETYYDGDVFNFTLYRNSSYIRFSYKTSKSIIKKHKDRFVKRPVLYGNILNMNAILRYTNSDDAKIMLKALLPDDVIDFWNHYGNIYEGLINKIPLGQRFEFLKTIFEEKYPGERKFEMNSQFYSPDSLYDPYKFLSSMTKKEKEIWALEHLKEFDGHFSEINDYYWYKFINFNTCFKDMKGFIHSETDYVKRIRLLEIVLYATSNQRELEILLKYFHERHINEQKKDKFINKVTEVYNVLEFDKSCWDAFNKLLYAVDVYNKSNYDTNLSILRTVVLLYHILHDIPLPEAISNFIINDLNTYYYIKRLFENFKDKVEMVYEYLVQSFVNEFKKNESQVYTEVIKITLRPKIQKVINIIRAFEKKLEDLPDLILKYMKLDEEFNRYFISRKGKKLTETDLLRLMKKDIALLKQKIPEVNDNLDGKLGTFFKKIKTYFSEDAAQEWLNFYLKVLNNKDNEDYKSIYRAVFAVYMLADNKKKKDILIDYAPSDAKIDYQKIDRHFLYVQEGLCRFMGYSRPPISPDLVMSYLKGDYVKYCVPIFNMYTANIPTLMCRDFIQLLLERPISIQKHGIRLAFKCFGPEDLAKLVLQAWDRTANKTIRKVIFGSLYDHLSVERDESMQIVLLELIENIMGKVKPDDHEDIFNYFKGNNIQNNIKGRFLECSWNCLNKFPDKTVQWIRKEEIVRSFTCYMDLMRENFIHDVVEEHVRKSLIEKIILDLHPKRTAFNDRLWDLAINYFTTNVNEKTIKRKMPLLQTIVFESVKMWNETMNDVYVIRKLFYNIIDQLVYTGVKYYLTEKDVVSVMPIYDMILNHILSSLPIYEICFIVLKLEIAKVALSVIDSYKCKNENIEDTQKDARKIFIEIGKELGVLMKELIMKKIIYQSSLNSIEQILNTIYTIFMYKLGSCSFDDLNVYMAVALVDVPVLEAHMLALNILPLECSNDTESDFKYVLEKLKSIANDELKCAIYLKYCNDCKRRKHV